MIAVKLGASTFDFRPLIEEQQRLAKYLLNPSPKDRDDPSQTFTVKDNRVPPNTYPTYIKVFFNKQNDIPTYKLFMKDNYNVEHDLSVAGTINIDNNSASVVGGYQVDPETGKIKNSTNNLVGYVKFEAESGLTLASVNTRITQVNQALEGLTKILTAVSGTLDSAISLIR